jgi:adenosylcobinamide-GDP ribazoletransferase
MRARAAEEAACALAALQFLTRLPVPADIHSPARMAASPRWYPAVGALVGGICALAWWAAAALFPPDLAALVAVATGVLVTGALHEDGLADTCDGMGGASAERALTIMRDSRIGSYGVLGLGLVLAAKVLALAALPAAAVPLVLVAGHATSRASMVLVLATGRYARAEGAAAPLAAGLAPGGFAFAFGCGVAALVSLVLVLPAPAVAGGLAALAASHTLVRLTVGRRIGGYTGDTLGAVQQAGEAGLYLGVLACL